MHTLILAPFTNMSVATTEALWFEVQCKQMDSDTSYFELLRDTWLEQKTFLIVEQDMVPTLEQIASLEDCEQDWCAYAYSYMESTHAGLGLCKFSGALQRIHPDTILETSKESTDAHPMNHWCNLDDRIRRVLTRYGVSQHIHEGLAVHLSPQPSHGCNIIS